MKRTGTDFMKNAKYDYLARKYWKCWISCWRCRYMAW